MNVIEKPKHQGKRVRLRKWGLAREGVSRTDDALLNFLLRQAIPQRNRPLLAWNRINLFRSPALVPIADHKVQWRITSPAVGRRDEQVLGFWFLDRLADDFGRDVEVSAGRILWVERFLLHLIRRDISKCKRAGKGVANRSDHDAGLLQTRSGSIQHLGTVLKRRETSHAPVLTKQRRWSFSRGTRL